MAKNQICKKTPIPEKQAVEFAFANGVTHTISMADFQAEQQSQLGSYGISQKFGDSYAGAESPDEAVETFLATVEQVKSGEWTVRRGGGGAARITMLVEALARVTGKTEEEAQAKIATLDDDEKKDLRTHPQIAAVLEEIKLDRQKAKLEKAKEAAADAAPLTI